MKTGSCKYGNERKNIENGMNGMEKIPSVFIRYGHFHVICMGVPLHGPVFETAKFRQENIFGDSVLKCMQEHTNYRWQSVTSSPSCGLRGKVAEVLVHGSVQIELVKHRRR
jgi:hypothetical protein